MTNTETKTKNKPRKIARWVLIAVFILLAGIYGLRGVLIAPHAIAFLERSLEANLGLRISIGELSGSYFSDLKVINVTTVERSSTGPLTELR